MTKYLALLRGINVGGNNIIKMVELKACFEELGFSDVVTYIQSGNVWFSTKKGSVEKITLEIEKALTKKLTNNIKVVVISLEQLKEVIAEAPKHFGKEPEKYRYDVIYVKAPLTAKEALKQMPLREEVDTAIAGTHAVYFSRLIARATQSKLSKVVALPVYKDLTIRNWNTTSKLITLVEKT